MARINLVKNRERKRSTINKKHQNEIINEFSPLIKYWAVKMSARTHYAIECDEMISYGVLGLIDAIAKYDKKRKNEFKTYAEFRIKGAMLDHLREQDPLSRSVRDKVKLVEKIKKELQEKLDREPKAIEMAKKMKISIDKYFELTSYARPVAFVTQNTDNVADPNDIVDRTSLKNLMINALATLDDKERTVVSLYYYDDANLKKIGQTMGISESRVSQLHSSAMLKLRNILNNLEEGY